MVIPASVGTATARADEADRERPADRAPVRKTHGPLRTRPRLPTVGRRAWKPGLGRTCPDYLAGGDHPEVLKGICLPPGPGDEFVQAPEVEPRVGVRQGPQGAPARGLSFHAEPQHFQFFEVAEG